MKQSELLGGLRTQVRKTERGDLLRCVVSTSMSTILISCQHSMQTTCTPRTQDTVGVDRQSHESLVGFYILFYVLGLPKGVALLGAVTLLE